ncbi:hypothetical protein [Sharpea azabuensis]|uniref:hypothetical protein n=1 Tax=Sharpea azabuensis TaxID=322505 RepID=UPI0015682E4C|nr:hypothetical protein [Sharpea azabuensis]
MLNKWRKDGNIIETDLQAALWPIIIYDKKYNEVLFKVGGRSVNDNFDHPVSLVYNEQQQQFSSVYAIDPSCYLQFGAQLILFDQSDNPYKWNQWNQNDDDTQISKGFYDEDLYPYIKFVINRNKEYTKVYDNMEFAGTIHGCFDDEEETLSEDIKFQFNTPLKQIAKTDGESITNRQYDFKFAIPRSGEYKIIHGRRVWITREYGDRLRGKTMQCEMSSTSNYLDFSLQYFITKYRMSWS